MSFNKSELVELKLILKDKGFVIFSNVYYTLVIY